jgi:hypothetical protein
MFARANVKVIETLLDKPIGHLAIATEDLRHTPITHGHPARLLAEQDAGCEAGFAPRAISITACAVHRTSMAGRQAIARWT